MTRGGKIQVSQDSQVRQDTGFFAAAPRQLVPWRGFLLGELNKWHQVAMEIMAYIYRYDLQIYHDFSANNI